MPATYVSRIVWYDLPIGWLADTQIVSLTRGAAKLFGAASPCDLAGEFMSRLQPWQWREAGHQRYFDRIEGRKLSKDYAVITRHPNGELVGQRREFLGWLHRRGPRREYLTAVKKTSQIDHPPIRVLSQEERQRYAQVCGTYTVADVERLLNAETPECEVDNLELLHDIIRECAVLSSSVFCGKYRTPLDLLLSPDVNISWKRKSEKAQTTSAPVVRPRFDCEFCGYRWYAKPRTRRKAQCPACRTNYTYT